MQTTYPIATPILEISAQKFIQGKRVVYQFAITVEQFDDIMPEKVEVDVIGDHNRRFTPKHAETIEDYLRTIDEWVLGPITICASAEWIQFKPYHGVQTLPWARLQCVAYGRKSEYVAR